VLRRLRFRRRADLLLLFVDAGCAALSCWLAFLLRFEGDPIPSAYVSRYWFATSAVAIGFVLTGRIAGLYRRQALRVGDSVLAAAFEAAVSTGVVVLVINYALLDGKISRAWIGLVILGLLLSAVISRGVLRRARRALVPLGIALERYAIVGDGIPARRLTNDLTRAAGAPYRIVDILSPSLGAEMLAEMAAVERLDGLIITAEAAPEHAAELATRLAGYGIEAFIAPRLGDLDMRVASISSFQGVPLLRVAGLAPRRRAVRHTGIRTLRRGVTILGTRGIPANYGGFETFAERLALYLVDKDVSVTVYCRRHHASGDESWNGVKLVTLPTIRSKYFDTVVHTTLSALHLLLRSRTRDVVLCNAANAPVLPLLRLFGCRVLMNVDGLEWRRGKWGVLGRSWYRMGEWLSVRASSVLITDADEVRTYYRVRHDTDSVMIPYGADLLDRNQELPADLDVTTDAFALYVSRWEPENNPLMVAGAHAAAGVKIPLVMLGKATYDEQLERDVRAAAAPTAVLPGPVFGHGYHALQSNARCYIHATEVGGTHPALIEAMGAANLVLVLDTPENREVAGPDAWYFADQDELAALIRKVAALSAKEVRRLGAGSRDRAARLFSWTTVGDAYLHLLRGQSLPIDVT
jgi:glycosyltransferase involved in cell wall biosynthesis